MDAVENVVRDQKVRFLASDIVLRGAPQTLEDVCRDCRLFSVTPTELLEFTSVLIKFGDCLSTALYIPSPGSIYVTSTFCQEIGRKSIVTPFSLLQNHGGNWSNKTYLVAPVPPGLQKSNISFRPVISEVTRRQGTIVDSAIPVLSSPPLGESHVSQCPSEGKTVRTLAGITDRKSCVKSVNGGSAISQAREAGKKTSLASLPRGSTEISTCPSNCEPASSQRPIEDGLLYRGDELGHQGLLQRHVNANSSTYPVQNTDEVTLAVGPLAAVEHCAPRRGRRPKAAQKFELTEAPKLQVDGGEAHTSALSSRVTRSATACVPKRELQTLRKKRNREHSGNVGEKETPRKRQRGRMKESMVPVADKEEIVEGDFSNAAHPGTHPVTWPGFGGFEHAEVVGETRISLSSTEKSGVFYLENPIPANVPTTEERGLPRKGRRKRDNVGSWMLNSTGDTSTEDGETQDVARNQSVVRPLATPGLTRSELVAALVPVVRGNVDVEVIGEARVSSIASEKSVGERVEYPGKAIKAEQGHSGKFNHPYTFSEFYESTDAVAQNRNENAASPEKSTVSGRSRLLYVSDSEEDSSTAELPSADVKICTSPIMCTNRNGTHDGPPRLPAAFFGADNRSLDSQMMQLQTVNGNVVNSADVEEATGAEVEFRTGSRQNLTRISNLLREMNTMITFSGVEHVEGDCLTGHPCSDEEILKFTAPDVQICRGIPGVEAKLVLDDNQAKPSRVAESSAVSKSCLCTNGPLDHAVSTTPDCPCGSIKAVFDEELKRQSRIDGQIVVSESCPKDATSSHAATARHSERTNTLASGEKIAVDAKLKHVKGDRKDGSRPAKGKVRFVSMKPEVGVEEGTHVKQTLGERLGSEHLKSKSEIGGDVGLVGDAVHVHSEELAAYPFKEVLIDTAIKGMYSEQKYSPAENQLLPLELGPLVHVNIYGTGDENLKRAQLLNKPGTSVGKNYGQPISKEPLAVQEVLVPASAKVIDPPPKQKNQEFKIVPEFDNFTVIGEEGSGGYGTVYRVINNSSGRIYAMKCPLLKTHPSCVENEINMLQQLGGKDSIIKFERVVPGRFRTLSDSGEKLSECKSILLEFMEHDKPEVLKKEITIEELRNYCVCLFRALAHMHRLRIMHLDVKPGNFLFSRLKKRGYLVDFNLARDEQKEPKRIRKVLPGSSHIISRIESNRSSKRPQVQDVASTPVSYSKRSRLLMGAPGTQLSYGTPSPAKALSVLQDQSNKYLGLGVSAEMKVSSPRLPDLAPSRSTTPMGALSSPRRTAESPKPALEHAGTATRQHCEGSADVQKNHTLGPRPQSGHRALLKYIQTKVYNQQPPVFSHQQSSLPASQRKRVAAVQNKRRNVAAGNVPVTPHAPQPLISRRLKAPTKPKGNNDQVKDGPCVGTKGYRAPEVLLRSLKQTTKVDIWSAGVSLLQLLSGRSPFPSTSTDGALKDIAKVRGSDKVLALATRHQRQHSISKELCAMRYPPITLKEWCEKHSRRPDLKGKIPPEFLDLLEKCLDVDPVSRITAEEALTHQFCSMH